MSTTSLIVPSHVAKQRTAELAQQQRRKGLGRAVHEIDPAQALFAALGMKGPGDSLTDQATGKAFRLHGNRVLVAVYERPEAIAVGDKKLYLSDQTRREDEHQGKAALVVMKGHSAFVSDDHFDFGPDNVEVGEWIALAVGDGRKLVVNGVLCRTVRDQDVICVIPSPDFVY